MSMSIHTYLTASPPSLPESVGLPYLILDSLLIIWYLRRKMKI